MANKMVYQFKYIQKEVAHYYMSRIYKKQRRLCCCLVDYMG